MESNSGVAEEITLVNDEIVHKGVVIQKETSRWEADEIGFQSDEIELEANCIGRGPQGEI